MKIKRLSNSSIVGNTLKLASSNVLMYVLPFIFTPILTRLYDPVFFGDWGVFSGLYSIVNIVIFLCYENAIVKSKNEEYVNVSLLSFITSFLIILIVFFSFLIGAWAGFDFLQQFPCKSFFILYLLFTTFYTIFLNIANKKELYWVMSGASIATGIIQVILRIFFGYVPIFNNGLIAGTTIAQLFAAMILVFCCFKVFKKDICTSDVSIRSITNVASKYQKFPLYDAPASLLAFSAFNLPVIILSFFYQKSEIGCYSVILQLLLLPMSFIGTAIGKVYYQEISKQGSESKISFITNRILKFTSIISILPLLFLAIGGDKIVTLYLGNNWKIAGDIAICLSLWSFPTILVQPIIPMYRYMNKQKHMLIYNSLYFVLGILTLYLMCRFGFGLSESLITYAFVCSLVKISMFFDLLKLSNLSLRLVFNNKIILLYIFSFFVYSIRLYYIILD